MPRSRVCYSEILGLLGKAGQSTMPRRIESTFGFIDLEGFTALPEAEGDEDAAQIATHFAKITGSVLGPGDRLVKTIGDAVLVTSPNAGTGVALVERLLTEAAADPRLPSLRAGLHNGSAVEKNGAVLCAAANLPT